MKRLHLSRTPRLGLGLLWTERGLGLSQSQASSAPGSAQQSWHWQALSERERAFKKTAPWPDPAHLRMARLRSGFQAQALALAVPESQLQRLSLSLEPDLSPKQMHAHIQTKLSDVLPWPVADTIWDFQLASHDTPERAKPHGPAWLQAAMQAQPQQTVDVVATPRAWVLACEAWCRAAGLALVRLEPPWQADARWQSHGTEQSGMSSLPLPDSDLSAHQQAVLGGLALGVVMP